MGRLNLKAELTRRETEIAELLAWGAARKEVADKLNISLRTVENTARNIYEKIGIQKATELCVYWFIAKLGVDPKRDPLRRTFIAFLLLLIYLPAAFSYQPDQQARTPRAPRVVRTATRSARARQEPLLFDNTDF